MMPVAVSPELRRHALRRHHDDADRNDWPVVAVEVDLLAGSPPPSIKDFMGRRHAGTLGFAPLHDGEEGVERGLGVPPGLIVAMGEVIADPVAGPQNLGVGHDRLALGASQRDTLGSLSSFWASCCSCSARASVMGASRRG
jgi:hypothetical protein